MREEGCDGVAERERVVGGRRGIGGFEGMDEVCATLGWRRRLFRLEGGRMVWMVARMVVEKGTG